MSGTAAFTIALGDEALRLARDCRATFKRFHPDIPFYIVEERLYRRFAPQNFIGSTSEILGLRALIGHFLAQRYGRVLYLDADILILGPLDALLTDAAVTVTGDLDCSYGFGEPLLNAGVVAATQREFWRAWMREIYSQLIPVMPNFLDQLALREICGRGAFSFFRIPEREEKVFYNLSIGAYPGAWRVENGELWKGDARLKLWHFAGGSGTSKKWQDLPEAPRQLAEASLTAAAPHYATEAVEHAFLHESIRTEAVSFQVETEAFFRDLPTVIREDFSFRKENFLPGIYVSDAPTCWDQYRNLAGTGIHARTLPGIPRIVYARDPAQLLHPDVEAGWDWEGYDGESLALFFVRKAAPTRSQM